jgi:hypothetical protein
MNSSEVVPVRRDRRYGRPVYVYHEPDSTTFCKENRQVYLRLARSLLAIAINLPKQLIPVENVDIDGIITTESLQGIAI